MILFCILVYVVGEELVQVIVLPAATFSWLSRKVSKKGPNGVSQNHCISFTKVKRISVFVNITLFLIIRYEIVVFYRVNFV